MKIDLHLHSNHSDGIYSVEKIIDLAREKGMAMIAITDHDCITGLPAALEYSQGKLNYVTGVEFTCREQKIGQLPFPCSVHLLGYNFDPQNLSLQRNLKQRSQRVYQAFQALIHSLSDFQMDFSYEEVPISCGKVMQLRDITAYVIQHFSENISLEDAKERILSYAKNLTEINFMLQQAVELIHNAGGTAVLAHPFHVYQNFSKTDLSYEETALLLNGMKEQNIDGIEAFYLGFSPKQRAYLSQTAQEYHWLTTIGSDFHGFPHRDSMADQLLAKCQKVPTDIRTAD